MEVMNRVIVGDKLEINKCVIALKVLLMIKSESFGDSLHIPVIVQ